MRNEKKDKIRSERAMSLGITAVVMAAVVLIGLLLYGLIEQWNEVKSWIIGLVCICSLVYLIVWYTSKRNR